MAHYWVHEVATKYVSFRGNVLHAWSYPEMRLAIVGTTSPMHMSKKYIRVDPQIVST